MGIAAATFVVLFAYWVVDYAVPPYFHLQSCITNSSTYNASLDKLNPNATEPKDYWCANGTTFISQGVEKMMVRLDSRPPPP